MFEVYNAAQANKNGGSHKGLPPPPLSQGYQ